VNYSVAMLSAAASGRRLPPREATLVYVAACARISKSQRWRQGERLSAVPVEDPDRANAATTTSETVR
jgi:hypothetical protein